MKKTFLGLLVSAFLAVFISPLLAAETIPNGDWWDTAVFYQIFPRSFYDSDGDKYGDLQGIIQKLDYLQDLGVTALWLCPVHPNSEGENHGYAVTDYYDIHEHLGTMEDYEELIEELHARDMYLVLDLVVNHTGNEHPWFVDSYSDLSSEYSDWYIWSETDPGWPNASGNTSLSGWNLWDEEGVARNGQYFYAAFNMALPDLNVENDDVSEELVNICQFWINKGVDGFRLDAVRYMIEEGNGKQLDTDSTIEWLKDFANDIKEIDPETYVIGEVYSGYDIAKTYYTEGEGMDAIFDFEISGKGSVIQGIFSTGKTSSFYKLLGEFEDVDDEGIPYEYFCPFFSNHDSGRMPENLQTPEKVKGAALLMFTLPGGAPYIYYGDEIGMREGFEMVGDANMRNPMWWDDTKWAGFTSYAPWTIKMKEEYYTNCNVAAQIDDPLSTLSFFKKIIAEWKESPVLQYGEIETIEANEDYCSYLDDPEKTIKSNPLVSYIRTLGNEAFMVILNPGRHELEVKQSIDSDFISENRGFITVTDSYGSLDFNTTADEEIVNDIIRGTFDFVLQPREFLVIKMEVQ